jgi:hypothetical protein
MATRLKTVQYGFTRVTNVGNNSNTQIVNDTLYLPEGTRTIKAAWVEISFDDLATSATNITTKTVSVALNGNSATTTNANAWTQSGENISGILFRDFTSHFQTHFTGSSATITVNVTLAQATTGFANVNTIVYITYEYDDTATTHLKTVWIPLNAPNTSLPTTKTSHDTVPALDTYLPEASKTYRNIHIITQGNTSGNSTTDFVLSYELSNLGTTTTGLYECALNTDRWTRFVWDVTDVLLTAPGYTDVTHTFNVWTSTGGGSRMNCMQAWMVVTYEFNASTTTSVMNSILLPMEIDTPLGQSNTIFQRSSREVWIQESNPSVTRISALGTYGATGNQAGFNVRIGSGSFETLTTGGSGFIAGIKGFMIRNDSPTGITLARGRNTLFLDSYETSATIQGGNYGVLWILNYTSDKHTDGVGAHNHTVIQPLHFHGTGGGVIRALSSAAGVPIPETDYFITAAGLKFDYLNSGTGVWGSPSVNMERLSAEGGPAFESAYGDAGVTDAETGLNTVWAQVRSLFKRWSGDTESGRMDVTTDRRYYMYLPNQANVAAAYFKMLSMYVTYHTITYNVSGNIAGSNGGTVNIELHRTGTSEEVKATSRTGNGSYSFTWFDDTENVYVLAKESDTLRCISKDDTAPGSDFDLNLDSSGGGGGGAGEYFF